MRQEMSEEKNWVSIAKTIDYTQASIWRDILTGEEIVVVLDPPQQHIEPYPQTVLAMEYDLFVREEDSEKALRILEEIESHQEIQE
jgi:hypothetical protein